MSDSSNFRPIGPMLPCSSKGSKENEYENDCLDEVSSSDQVIGPTIPSNFRSRNVNENDDDDEDFGPALPPGFESSSNSDCQLGPSLPDHFVLDDEDESDYIIGPVPEGQDDKNHQYDVSKRKYKSGEKVSKREKWMLEPPKVLAKTLQTKSATKFSQKSSKKDTPLTKEQKLEMELVAEKEGKMKEFLNKYEKSNKRDVSLLEQHRKDMNTIKKPKYEKTERREFDRDKDLNVPKMDSKKKNSFIKESSSTFSTRFSSGKFEKFL